MFILGIWTSVTATESSHVKRCLSPVVLVIW